MRYPFQENRTCRTPVSLAGFLGFSGSLTDNSDSEAVRQHGDEAPQSPGFRELDNYNEDLRQVTPQCATSVLETVVNTEIQPLEERLRELLPGLIVEAQSRTFWKYQARTSSNRNAESNPLEMVIGRHHSIHSTRRCYPNSSPNNSQTFGSRIKMLGTKVPQTHVPLVIVPDQEFVIQFLPLQSFQLLLSLSILSFVRWLSQHTPSRAKQGLQ